MLCSGCGVEAPALKTVRWRRGERLFPLCDPCWEAVARYVWIVAGPVPAHGTCRSCGHWRSLRELSEMSGGRQEGRPLGDLLGVLTVALERFVSSGPPSVPSSPTHRGRAGTRQPRPFLGASDAFGYLATLYLQVLVAALPAASVATIFAVCVA